MRARINPSLLALLFLASISPHNAQASNQSAIRPLKMSQSSLQLDWTVDMSHELDCGGGAIAGGHSSGPGNFTHLGKSTIEVSAAWDIGHQLDPSQAKFFPTGPAGGPVAPVLGTGAYPYEFKFNPFTDQCGAAVTATGAVILTAANGDQVFGEITGGEAFRLDFTAPGDGAETFATVTIIGGTGRFESATGSFVTHTIIRFDFDENQFVMDLAEVLPEGTIVY